MSHKPVISVKCPCCGEVLEVDVAKERVLSHRRGPHLADDRRAGEDVLDVAIRNARAAEERLKTEFLAAQDKVRNQSDHLDKLFREAQKKVRETPPDPNDPGHGPKWD